MTPLDRTVALVCGALAAISALGFVLLHHLDHQE